jgi:hypothetical protein
LNFTTTFAGTATGSPVPRAARLLLVQLERAEPVHLDPPLCKQNRGHGLEDARNDFVRTRGRNELWCGHGAS